MAHASFIAVGKVSLCGYGSKSELRQRITIGKFIIHSLQLTVQIYQSSVFISSIEPTFSLKKMMQTFFFMDTIAASTKESTEMLNFSVS